MPGAPPPAADMAPPCLPACSYMVVNGATKHGDMAHFDAQVRAALSLAGALLALHAAPLPLQLAAFRAAGGDASYEYLHTQNLVALQGPASPTVLAKVRRACCCGAVACISRIPSPLCPHSPPPLPSAGGRGGPRARGPHALHDWRTHARAGRRLHRDALRLHGCVRRRCLHSKCPLSCLEP